MSHLQANLRTSELLSSVIFGVPKCLLLTVLFVSKAAGPWVVVDGLLSWCSFHFQLKLPTSAGSDSYTRTEDHPLLPTGQQVSKQKEL
jgi:hypothetical protein